MEPCANTRCFASKIVLPMNQDYAISFHTIPRIGIENGEKTRQCGSVILGIWEAEV